MLPFDIPARPTGSAVKRECPATWLLPACGDEAAARGDLVNKEEVMADNDRAAIPRIGADAPKADLQWYGEPGTSRPTTEVVIGEDNGGPDHA